MRLPAALLAAALSLGGCSPADQTSEVAPDLGTRVEDRLAALQAETSLYAKHLPSGREIAIRADVPMNTLSVIKIPVMIRAYMDHAEGRLDLDARTVVRPEDRRRGSGLLQTFSPGLEPTLRDLTTQMIITSDNTATDMMIERVGMERTNALLETHGYSETAVRMTTGDLFRQVWVRADPAHASLTHAEVYERGFPGDEAASARSFAFEGDSTMWLGRTTAREMSRLLEQLLEGDFTDEEATQGMIGTLQRQLYASRLPQRIQWTGVTVAHKTGDWPPIAGNDVGILFYEGGPTIISVFTNQNRGDFFELEATLGLIAEDIVTEWR